MKKHINKIIIAVSAVILLAIVYWWGGGSASLRGWTVNTEKVSQQGGEASKKTASKALPADNHKSAQTEKVKKAGEKATEENKPEGKNNQPMTAAQKIELAEKIAEKTDSGKVSKNSENTGDENNNTVVCAQEKPLPSETQNTVKSNKEQTCTLSVRCDTILKNMAWLNKEKTELIPKDGVLLAKQTVIFYEGESVFNLLVREMKKNKIHMEFTNTPIYNSAYIEGIGNIYEFDCGELSGWMYKVNGWFPNYGCSRYLLKAGDDVEWVYTCDLGIDVGGYYSSGQQKEE